MKTLLMRDPIAILKNAYGQIMREYEDIPGSRMICATLANAVAYLETGERRGMRGVAGMLAAWHIGE